MNIYEFMSSSPYLSFFIAFVIAHTLFLVINRLFRCINIFKNGYPPLHCDADGDFKQETIE